MSAIPELGVRRAALLRTIPFALFMLALALRGGLESGVDTRWLYPVQASIAGLALVLLWKHFHELRPSAGGLGGVDSWLLAVAVGLAVFVLWINLTAPWMRIGEPIVGFVPLDAEGRLDWRLIALRAAGACLVVPLVEELFWRSFLMRWIDRRDFLDQPPQRASLLALMASSAVFALGHDLWLAGLLAGLMFGALYRHGGQIWHAIVAHAVANLALAVWVVRHQAWSFW